eukprot:TRINITY_DN5105_c0_g1_i4.p1 TRINITY_DN5105_c0_g1~~TRINITY_DN5105_c0_g1_i4.p1  ORF type:complete len:297 (+),score=72.04 TRINITY_DN5105_c0_g1_i4:81-971(+)
MSRSWRESILNAFLPSPQKNNVTQQNSSQQQSVRSRSSSFSSQWNKEGERIKEEYRIQCTLNAENYLPGSILSCRIDVENVSKRSNQSLHSSQGDAGDSIQSQLHNNKDSKNDNYSDTTFNNVDNNNNNNEEKKSSGINWICISVFGNVSWDEKWFKSPRNASNTEELYRTSSHPRFMHDPRYKLHLDQFPESFLPIIDPSHSIGDKSEMVFSTPLYFLTGFVPIDAHEQKSYVFQCNLPYSLPPTYKGTAVRYKYAVSVSVQPLNEQFSGEEETPIGTLQIPFRVLNPISGNIYD